VAFKCRYVRLPAGYALSSLSWGSGSCFFVASVQIKVNEFNEHPWRSGVLIYRFKHWHAGWHSDKLRPPHFLLHSGLKTSQFCDDAHTEDEWREDRFVLCPENYALSSGVLLPPSLREGCNNPLVAVQVELDPCSCRLFVVYAHTLGGGAHIAA
jgi:hypothetical protein